MPPNYHLESFWNTRFEKERHFEWLGDGTHTIIPTVRDYLEKCLSAGVTSHIPRLLHIGAGSSTLSEALSAAYEEIYGDRIRAFKSVLVNTDFSENAVDLGRARDNGRLAVDWIRSDMLSWEDTLSLSKAGGSKDRAQSFFDVVVDKSTSDAISCAEDIVVNEEVLDELTGHPSTQSPHPGITKYLSECPDRVLTVEPLEILAFNLAYLVRPGGIWVALSYSKARFPFLTGGSDGGSDMAVYGMGVNRYWEIVEVKGVAAPSGQDKGNVFAPELQHFLYILQRTELDSQCR